MVGKVAYHLDLPPEAAIHSTFHVSQLKKYRGHHAYLVSNILSTYIDDELEPSQVLDRKMVKRGNKVDNLVLICWKNVKFSNLVLIITKRV